MNDMIDFRRMFSTTLEFPVMTACPLRRSDIAEDNNDEIDITAATALEEMFVNLAIVNNGNSYVSP